MKRIATMAPRFLQIILRASLSSCSLNTVGVMFELLALYMKCGSVVITIVWFLLVHHVAYIC